LPVYNIIRTFATILIAKTVDFLWACDIIYV
jgi:hypothetical protein